MDSAHRRANELVAEGRFSEADPWFLNALARQPGDLALIRDFVSAVSSAASAHGAERPQAARQQLEWLADFLSQRVIHVAPDDLDELLELRSQIQTSTQVAPERSSGGATRAAEKERDQLVARHKSRLPESLETLRKLAGKLEALPRSPSSDEILERVAAATAFEELQARAKAQFEVAEKPNRDPVDAAYILQGVESLLREAYSLVAQLDEKRTKKLASLRVELERASRAAAERQAAAESKEAWDDWSREHKKTLASVSSWNPPEKGAPKGRCQSQLRRLQDVAGSLQELLSGRLKGGPAERSATKELEAVGSQMRRAAEAQQRLYNRWAMGRVEETFRIGCGYLGVVSDDKEDLENLIVKQLGPVDQRLLSPEVQRCYAEVFEYLFSKLAAPKKDAAGFKKKGSKLRLLKRMSESEKTSMDKF